MTDAKPAAGFRSGFVALIGRPNVGKSSLVNALIGRKVSIVSPKPQTTRRRIQAVLNLADAQVVLLDTPGVQRPRDLLGKELVRAANAAMDGVDAALLIVDATRSRGEEDRSAARMLRRASVPGLLVVNKVDLLSSGRREAAVEAAEALEFEGPVLPVSALTGEGLAGIKDWIGEKIGLGPRYYPDGMSSDQPEEIVVAELIREQILLRLGDEVPHDTAVIVQEMTDRPGGKLFVGATIVVERQSQKAIVIGSGGRLLKEIGSAARAGIEDLLQSDVYLDLFVRVEKGWRDDIARLREYGYES